MSRSISRSSTTSEGGPRVWELTGPGRFALTVDVEEWYHTCHVPEYVLPEVRPRLPEELDRLLPEMLERLARAGRTATFFVLGEVAARLPGRVREIADAGHEVASHGELHLRVNGLEAEALARQLRDCRARLEDLVGTAILGYRAPEWSLRWLGNPRLRVVAEAGFRYDSSLVRTVGSGHRGNPRRAVALRWEDGLEILELPPLTFGTLFPLPAGGWTGRLAGADVLLAAARRHQRSGGVALFVVHPWELARRPTPGDLTGIARFLHETGRMAFPEAFDRILEACALCTLRVAVEGLAPSPVAARRSLAEPEARLPVSATL